MIYWAQLTVTNVMFKLALSLEKELNDRSWLQDINNVDSLSRDQQYISMCWNRVSGFVNLPMYLRSLPWDASQCLLLNILVDAWPTISKGYHFYWHPANQEAQDSGESSKIVDKRHWRQNNVEFLWINCTRVNVNCRTKREECVKSSFAAFSWAATMASKPRVGTAEIARTSIRDSSNAKNRI